MSLPAIHNKRGLSAVIGYVILIVISISMSVVVYQWLKSYANPSEVLTCPEETSIFIKSISYTCTPGAETLNITVKNNGKFSVNGYFIHVTDSPDPEALATIDISPTITLGGKFYGSAIVFNDLIMNYLTPGEPDNVRMSSFNVSGYVRFYRVEIIPIRIQEEKNRKRTVSCGNAKVSESIACS